MWDRWRRVALPSCCCCCYCCSTWLRHQVLAKTLNRHQRAAVRQNSAIFELVRAIDHILLRKKKSWWYLKRFKSYSVVYLSTNMHTHWHGHYWRHTTSQWKTRHSRPGCCYLNVRILKSERIVWCCHLANVGRKYQVGDALFVDYHHKENWVVLVVTWWRHFVLHRWWKYSGQMHSEVCRNHTNQSNHFKLCANKQRGSILYIFIFIHHNLW